MICGAVGVGQRLREDRAARRELRLDLASGPALGIFLWSRAAIWAGALFALYWFEPHRHPNADRWDGPILHDLGAFTDVWARWDSSFFLGIAEHGYDRASAAFYPLYPALARGSLKLGVSEAQIHRIILILQEHKPSPKEFVAYLKSALV